MENQIYEHIPAILGILVKVKVINYSEALEGGGGNIRPLPQKPKKIVVKMLLFQELYKMAKVQEDRIKNGLKINFH